MSRFNRSPSQSYRTFVSTVQEYVDTDQETGEGVTRALADALSDEMRERFKDYWEVERTTETACLRRLITGEDECICKRSWIDREVETIGEDNKPPHKPPHADHASLWLDGMMNPPSIRCTCITQRFRWSQKQQTQRNGWFDIVRCAEHWGLEIAVMPVWWYNAMSTVNIVYTPEREQNT